MTILTSYVYMSRKKITILTENEIDNHQIYVPVFYLIEINILIAFWGQKWWNFMILSSLTVLPLHANARCEIRGKKIKFSKILEFDIFNFIFGISFKNWAIQAQTRPYSDKDFVNPPICLIWILAFKIEFSSSRRIGCSLPKIVKNDHFNFLRLHGWQENYNFDRKWDE